MSRGTASDFGRADQGSAAPLTPLEAEGWHADIDATEWFLFGSRDRTEAGAYSVVGTGGIEWNQPFDGAAYSRLSSARFSPQVRMNRQHPGVGTSTIEG